MIKKEGKIVRMRKKMQWESGKDAGFFFYVDVVNTHAKMGRLVGGGALALLTFF